MINLAFWFSVVFVVLAIVTKLYKHNNAMGCMVFMCLVLIAGVIAQFVAPLMHQLHLDI